MQGATPLEVRSCENLNLGSLRTVTRLRAQENVHRVVNILKQKRRCEKGQLAVLVAFQKYTHRNRGLKKLSLVKQVFNLTQKKKIADKDRGGSERGGNNKCGIDVQDGKRKRLHKFNASQKNSPTLSAQCST